MNLRNATRTLAMVFGLWQVTFGLWAFFAPTSFFARIAAYPPYNEHLLHDLGAFQLGLGAALVAALVWSDALVAALAGNVVGATFHFAAHVADVDLGGRVSDPLTLGLIAVAPAVALVMLAKAERQ